jgi:hypothetical protein
VTLAVARPLLQHRLPPRGAVAVHRSPDAGRDETRGGLCTPVQVRVESCVGLLFSEFRISASVFIGVHGARRVIIENPRILITLLM